MPQVQQAFTSKPKQVTENKTTVPLTRSDSTLPVTYLPVSNMRIWSWELGDAECVHSGIIEVNAAKGFRLFVHAKKALKTAVDVTALNVENAEETSITADIDVAADKLYIIEASLQLKTGSYIFKFKSKKEILIAGFSITEIK